MLAISIIVPSHNTASALVGPQYLRGPWWMRSNHEDKSVYGDGVVTGPGSSCGW